MTPGADVETDVSLRVAADHARALAFLIGDGNATGGNRRKVGGDVFNECAVIENGARFVTSKPRTLATAHYVQG